ncbi:MAG TPA: class I SAM-dependent methyltransferase [Polyangiaceae bacterium]|nr:class I SAM-dependent methyltransferase [Polyangiaceae bacterium]
MAERVRSREPELKLDVTHAGSRAHYDDPVYYDKAYASRRDDVAYYVRLGRLSGGPVLEYGVGTGRIALPLARAGIAVTGVDQSKPMLERLAAALSKEAPDVRGRVRAVHGDMRDARVRGRFPLVIAAFNTLLHLYTREDVERFLASVRAHLAPGGRFVFDVSVPHADYLGADPAKRFGAPRFRHPARGLVKYDERFEYDPLAQVLLTEMRFSPADGTAPWTVPLTHRQFFPREIEALLHYNGFADLEWFGDFTDGPPDWEVDSLVVHASVRGAKVTGENPGKSKKRPPMARPKNKAY